jgi:putative hemolysin
VGEALGLAATRPHAWYPVCDGDLDRICGIAGLLDLVAARPADPLRGLLRPALFVPESQRPLETLAILRERGGGPVIVVDEHGRTEGIATAGDIAEALLGQPHRAAPAPVAVPAEPGSWLVSGGMRRGEFEEAFGVRLPPGRYQTLGGLILWKLGRMPRVGEEVVAGRAALKVAAATGRGVTAVKVTPPPR